MRKLLVSFSLIGVLLFVLIRTAQNSFFLAIGVSPGEAATTLSTAVDGLSFFLAGTGLAVVLGLVASAVMGPLLIDSALLDDDPRGDTSDNSSSSDVAMYGAPIATVSMVLAILFLHPLRKGFRDPDLAPPWELEWWLGWASSPLDFIENTTMLIVGSGVIAFILIVTPVGRAVTDAGLWLLLRRTGQLLSIGGLGVALATLIFATSSVGESAADDLRHGRLPESDAQRVLGLNLSCVEVADFPRKVGEEGFSNAGILVGEQEGRTLLWSLDTRTLWRFPSNSLVLIESDDC